MRSLLFNFVYRFWRRVALLGKVGQTSPYPRFGWIHREQHSDYDDAFLIGGEVRFQIVSVFLLMFSRRIAFNFDIMVCCLLGRFVGPVYYEVCVFGCFGCSTGPLLTNR